MIEEVLVTARYNAKIDPSLDIWTWEVAIYLFLGGMTAGLMIYSAVVHLLNKQDRYHFVANQLPLWAPVVLSIGMTTLFLDLEHKLYVFRFYTTIQPSSPMSIGSWVLQVVYLICFLMILATLRQGYPRLAAMAEKLPLVTTILNLSEKYLRIIALWSIPVGIALGIYTGILLSTFSARPFWNTGVLGLLFLVSGLSTAAALIAVSAKEKLERESFARLDAGIITIELLFIGLLIIGLSTGGRVQLESLAMIMTGDYALAFWGLFVTLGLVIPLIVELWHMRGGRVFFAVAPVLVLFGGYMLRHLTLELGQASNWHSYDIQFDPALLERLQ